MLTFSIDTENSLAVQPDKEAAIKEAGATGAAFATKAQLSEGTALWPASRLLATWNSFAGAPPFADLKEVKKFTDRKTAVVRIWTAAQRLGEALEQKQIAPPAPVVKAAKAIAPAASHSSHSLRLMHRKAVAPGVADLNSEDMDVRTAPKLLAPCGQLT